MMLKTSVAALVLAAGIGARAGGSVVSIGSSKDNTLFGDFGAAGSISNGAGPHFFVGTAHSGTGIRRGVMTFDIASYVPAGSTINAATLSLNCSRSVVATTTVSLNRLTADWGEGASDSGTPGGAGAPAEPGDATWLHTFYPSQLWTTPGGDFDPTASATFTAGLVAAYSVSAAGMASDVGAWLASPGANFGWMIRADATFGAMRFDSRENIVPSVRPALAIDYTTGGPPSGTWSPDADGGYSTASNWNGAVPNSPGATAMFGSVISADRSVDIDAGFTVGVINFNSANRYTLTGTGALMIDGSSSGAINVFSGSHTIASAVHFSDSTTVHVPLSGSVLTMDGDLTADGGVTITKSGAGALEVSRVQADALAVTAGNVRVLPDGSGAGDSSVESLSIAGSTGAWTASLDLSDNAMTIDYTGPSPVAIIRDQLTAGYNGGDWTGNGIRSSIAAVESSGAHKTALGYTDTGSIRIAYTYAGDASLDGTVDTVDFNLLAASFSLAGKDWGDGDFSFDQVVDSIDFNLLASNFSLTLLAADLGATVPEPAACTLVSLLVQAFLLTRRRASTTAAMDAPR